MAALCEYCKRRQALGQSFAKLELYLTFQTVTVSLVICGCVSGSFDLAAVFEWISGIAFAGYPWILFAEQMDPEYGRDSSVSRLN